MILYSTWPFAEVKLSVDWMIEQGIFSNAWNMNTELFCWQNCHTYVRVRTSYTVRISIAQSTQLVLTDALPFIRLYFTLSRRNCLDWPLNYFVHLIFYGVRFIRFTQSIFDTCSIFQTTNFVFGIFIMDFDLTDVVMSNFLGVHRAMAHLKRKAKWKYYRP